MQVYVGNLPINCTDDELRKLFEPYGKVRLATMGRDRKTEETQGYGFVEMPVKSEARAAIEALRGKEIEGKPLRVRALKPGDDFTNTLSRYREVATSVRKYPVARFREISATVRAARSEGVENEDRNTDPQIPTFYS